MFPLGGTPNQLENYPTYLFSCIMKATCLESLNDSETNCDTCVL